MNLELQYYNDIKCNKYLFDLKPWKNGELATIDGWGRFATFTISEKDKIKIKAITDFPKKQITEFMKTFPEVGIMYAASMFQLHYFVDVETKVCKEIWPFTHQAAQILDVHLLDEEKKFFLLTYKAVGESDSFEYLIYDFPNGQFLNNPYKDKNIFKKDIFNFKLNNGKFICYARNENDVIERNNVYLYDILKNEKFKNKLTEFLSLNTFDIITHDERKLLLFLKKSFDYIILNYDENYDNIKIEPLVMQTTNENKIYSIFVSDDLKWAFVALGGYKGINGEPLEKYGFIDLSKPIRYIIKTEDFYKAAPGKLAFMKHPIHGTIFLFEIEVNKKKHIRFYKMNDVEKIIQEYLLKQVQNLM